MSSWISFTLSNYLHSDPTPFTKAFLIIPVFPSVFPPCRRIIIINLVIATSSQATWKRPLSPTAKRAEVQNPGAEPYSQLSQDRSFSPLSPSKALADSKIIGILATLMYLSALATTFSD